MPRALQLRDIPGRVTTGAYILHSGLDKWRADDSRAAAVHAMAANAFRSGSACSSTG